MDFSRLQDDTIYLDHAATTPVDPEVLAVMLPYFTERFGNPSSIYRLGQEGRAALDRARAAVARVLGCQPAEIVFTSGATESDNLALKGVAWHRRLRQAADEPVPHIVTTRIEHHAVLHSAQTLERQGFAVTYVACDRDGFVAVADVEAALRPGHAGRGGLGLGLPGARRLMDEFDVTSDPDAGTIVTMTKWRTRDELELLRERRAQRQ